MRINDLQKSDSKAFWRHPFSRLTLFVLIIIAATCFWIFQKHDAAVVSNTDQSPAVTHAPSEPVTDVRTSPSPRIQPSAYPKREEPSPEELKIIAAHMAAATRLLKECEKKNATTVFDHEYEGLSHWTILRFTPPTNEQLSAVYDEITRGLSELKDGGAGEKKFRRMSEGLLRDYTNYPRKVKAVIINSFSAPDKPPRVHEIFANEESEYLPREDGSFVIPTHQYYRLDENLGGKNSWAASRYDHLFEVGRE